MNRNASGSSMYVSQLHQYVIGGVRCWIPVFQAFVRLRQEDGEFQTIQGHTVKHCLKKPKQSKAIIME